ncbi:beta/alpha barrel domain-containing protein [Defluviitalea phaphyphila]|uniref:DUF2090 domain-containing protein n=1 Tax=Defluviitalea phaphyphila TaxID=1473580 RepID=UPI00073076F2|nr:DUF2090 domain-containing protein [Defluviitalea phaphyphila]
MTKKEKIKSLTKDGIFHIFAIDHRDVFTKAMEEKSKSTAKEDVLEEKIRLIQAVKDMTSAVLIDTFYFFDDSKLDQHLEMEKAVVGIERFDYNMTKIASGADYLTTDISIKELGENGCNMVKLFVLYNPETSLADKMDKVIEYVQDECEKFDIPFLLEPILHEYEQKDQLRLTKAMLTRLKKFNVDIYKILFPGNIKENSYEENLEICKEIDEILDTPWILLSSGVPFDEFKEQLEIAGKAGACGYAVGRSVWGKYICEEDLEGMKLRYKDVKNVADKYCNKWGDKNK